MSPKSLSQINLLKTQFPLEDLSRDIAKQADEYIKLLQQATTEKIRNNQEPSTSFMIPSTSYVTQISGKFSFPQLSYEKTCSENIDDNDDDFELNDEPLIDDDNECDLAEDNLSIIPCIDSEVMNQTERYLLRFLKKLILMNQTNNLIR